MVPLGFGGRRFAEVRVEGYAPRADEDMSATRVNVAPSYASTMGIAIRAGREITADDGPGTLPVALVNETFAHHFWPSGSAIGRRIDLGRGWMTIVGVLADGKYEKLDEAPQAVAYVPLTQWWQPAFTIHVRTDRNARLLIESVRRALHQVNVDLPVIQPRTLAEHAAASTFVERVGASVLGAFGLAAFALSVLGLYGTLAFTVAARRRELAIRLALGASRRSVVAMVARHAVRVTAGGLVCGIVLALLAGAFVRAQIPRMRMADPIVYVAACGALLLAAVVAAWLPARRAVRIDPAAVLQSG
jgi:hypothetical protein